jgi:glucosamine--fructose-6-phosphate aminotransferase (isomerizing)
VAATKTFTSQVAVLTKLAVKLAEKKRAIAPKKAAKIMKDLEAAPGIISEILYKTEPRVKNLVKKYKDKDSFCFLGRGINYATALEGRLKLLEISYVPALCYPAGESKHGFISVVHEGYPILFIAPNDETRSKIIGNIMEMKARNASVIALIEEGDKEIKKIVDDYVELPKHPTHLLLPIMYIVPLQLFAYYMAVERGFDPDKPRSLAKSVTVE